MLWALLSEGEWKSQRRSPEEAGASSPRRFLTSCPALPCPAPPAGCLSITANQLPTTWIFHWKSLGKGYKFSYKLENTAYTCGNDCNQLSSISLPLFFFFFLRKSLSQALGQTSAPPLPIHVASHEKRWLSFPISETWFL